MNALAEPRQLLKTLNLRGLHTGLEELLEEAQTSNWSYLDFTTRLLKKEIEDRNQRRLKRNFAGAHFPVLKSLEDFEFERIGGLTRRECEELLDFRWLDQHQNLILLGLPGLGKTHLSIALGQRAIEKGYKVCFERITNLIRLLGRADIQRVAQFRLNRLLAADLLIIDEIGYTPIERKEANQLFTLISEFYERTSIILTSNKSFDDWAEMLGDEIMTTAMLDRLLHHAHIFSLTGDSYRIAKKKEVNS